MARVGYEEAELPVNVFRVMANAPAVAKGYLSLGGRLLSQGRLEAKLRELVINALAVQLDCPYEWGHHAGAALTAGATTEELQALRDGTTDALGPLERAVVGYARKVDTCTVADEDVDALRTAGLDDGQIVELTVLAGFYGMTARTLRALDVDQDEGTPRDFTLPS